MLERKYAEKASLVRQRPGFNVVAYFSIRRSLAHTRTVKPLSFTVLSYMTGYGFPASVRGKDNLEQCTQRDENLI